MAAFSEHAERENRLDWQILRDGGVSLYWRGEYLQEHIEWLRHQSYEVFPFNCEEWISEDAMHSDLQRGLALPSYYGRNLNALRDSIEELPVPEIGGFTIVLNHFDTYYKNQGTIPTISGCPVGEAVLDAFARGSRYFLLTGRRFLTLVQSDDPRIQFEKLACMGADWNQREFLYKDRGLDSSESKS